MNILKLLNGMKKKDPFEKFRQCFTRAQLSSMFSRELEVFCEAKREREKYLLQRERALTHTKSVKLAMCTASGLESV